MIEWPWPAPEDDGGARHLTRGTALPDIALPTSSGGSVSLARLEGRAIVFVYPWTGRPGVANPPGWDEIAGAHGSTPQSEGFRNLHSAFDDLDTVVLGLSTQAPDWQAELAKRMRLPFDLISDEQFALANALNLPRFETGGVSYLRRLTISIENGRIDAAFYPVHPPDAHARDILAWLVDEVGYGLESRLRTQKA